MSDIEVTIEALGARGDGLVTHAGEIHFVPGGVPGDRVKVRIGDGKRLLEIEDIIDRSPDRRDPPCAHFGKCGGCQLQHFEDALYAQWLKIPISAALAQHGLSANILAPHISPPNSRRRASFTARWFGSDLHLGFEGRRSHQTVDVQSCDILTEELFDAMESLRAFFRQYLPRKAAGRAQLTQAQNGLDAHISGVPLSSVDVHMDLASLGQTLGLARLTVDDGGVPDIAWQQDAPFVQLGGAKVDLPVGGFLQATQAGEAALVETVQALAGEAKHVADLFCGIGTFSFALAEGAKVDAYEAWKPAVDTIRSARRPKGMRQVSPIHRDLFRRPLLPKELSGYDAVVFDPPRAGAKEQCRQLANSSVANVIAVSCNPNTFARDAALLVEGGYELGDIQPVGQFLWSTHVELLAHFKKT